MRSQKQKLVNKKHNARTVCSVTVLRCVAFAGLVLGLVLGISTTFVSAEPIPPPENSCRVCHGEETVEYDKSIHSRRQIECVDCHGGNPASLDEDAMAPSAGFKQKPDKKGIAELCGSCHGDERMMTPYGLPTDQYDLYRISVHGTQLYERNDQNVATCTDCHESHAILPPEDPSSPVYVRNVPATCERCHSNKALMAKYGLPADQQEKYERSVHGKALLEQGLTGVPTCATCHGVHGATPPGVTDISNVCGQCHSNTRTYFTQSPHKKAMDELGMKECTSCHDNHDIEKPTLAMFDEVCVQCHDKDSKGFEVGQRLKKLMIDTDREIEQTRKLIEEAAVDGVYTQDYEFMLDEGKTNLVQVVPVLHTLSISEVETIINKANDSTHTIQKDLKDYYQSLEVRKFGLAIFWVFIIASVIFIGLRVHRANQDWKAEQKAASNSQQNED